MTAPTPRPPLAMRFSAATLIAAVLVSGCGSSSPGTPPARWASAFCSALQGWSSSTKAAATAYQSRMGSQTDAATVRSDTLDFLTTQMTLIDALIHAVQKAGYPAVVDGKKESIALVNAFSAYRQVVANGQLQLGQTSPSNTQGLSSTLDTIGIDIDNADAALGKAVAAVGKRYSGSADQPLVHALNSNQSCRAFATH